MFIIIIDLQNFSTKKELKEINLEKLIIMAYYRKG